MSNAKDGMFIVVCLYCFLSLFAILAGVMGAKSGCYEPETRIESIFPAYALACWAFQEKDGKTAE